MGDIAVEVKLPGQVEPDILAVAVPESADRGLSNGARLLDERLNGRLRQLVADGELHGELGQTVVLHTDGELNARRVAAAGIGRLDGLDADGIRTAAASVARVVEDVGGTFAWLLDETLPLPLDEQAKAVVEGVVLGSYRPGRWKTEHDRAKEITRIVLCADDEPGLVDAARRAARVAHWANWARDLANSPPNELTPAGWAERTAALDLPSLQAEAIGPQEMGELGMGALAAVGRASANEPRLIVLRHEPAPPARGEPGLGDLYGGLFANDEAWREEILAAAKRSGDHLWPFPMHPRFRRYVDSDYADLKNATELRQASPALAAAFLEEFAGDGPWAHIDMSGPGFLERSRGDYLTQRGGTGYGV